MNKAQDVFSILYNVIYKIRIKKKLVPYQFPRSEIIEEIINKKPTTREELLKIKWFWIKMFDLYGQEILNFVETYLMNWIWFATIDIPSSNVVSSNSVRERYTINSYKKYSYWTSRFPWYVVVKREWCFWAIRGEGAKIVSEVTWFKVGILWNGYITWSPQLDFIVYSLNKHCIDYIVVEMDNCIDIKSYK